MKIYAIVDGEGYQIKTVEETEKAYKITWDFEAGTMTVADEESAITIPSVRYNYDEMCHKLNVNYYIKEYEGTQLETGVTAIPKKTAQTIKPSKGYDGLKQVAIEATPLETKSATPTTSEQEIVATTEGKIGLSKVTVSAVTADIDANIVAGNIKNGVTILGVEGSYEGSATLPSDEIGVYLNVSSSSTEEIDLLQALDYTVAQGVFGLSSTVSPIPAVVIGTNLTVVCTIEPTAENLCTITTNSASYTGEIEEDPETGDYSWVVTENTQE